MVDALIVIEAVRVGELGAYLRGFDGLAGERSLQQSESSS